MDASGDVDLAAVAELLAAKETELSTELGLLTAPPDANETISFGKRVGDGTAMAVERFANVSVHDRLRSVLTDVRRAQAKLQEHSYGRCDSCGQPIGEARLEARPWAVRCVRCAGA